MITTHEFHKGAKYVATEECGTMGGKIVCAWRPTVWIDYIQSYVPIKCAPLFASPDVAIRWARENW